MGPTASGKSALALAVAKKRPTVIINADAMQMYRELRIVTARPTEDDLAQAEHAMYGAWPAHVHGTVALWAHEAAALVEHVLHEGRRPMLVGGTGMYVRALMEGLSPIPQVPAQVSEGVRQLQAEGGTQAVRAALESCDPQMAARLKPGDTQRNMRALEVFHATGRSLAYWQSVPGVSPLPDVQFRLFALLPERGAVYAAIDARVRAMVAQGAVQEVEALLALGLPAHLPVLKAHGVQGFGAYLRGECGLEEAVAFTQLQSRHYAKRQMTWLRRQCPEALDAALLLLADM